MWIENIHARISSSEQYLNVLENLSAFRGSGYASGAQWFACYQNLDVANEISIQLAWKEGEQPRKKTNCGLLISRYLAQHGLVRHTLWEPC